MNAIMTKQAITIEASYNKAIEIMSIIGIPQKAIVKAIEIQNEIAFMIRNGMDADTFATNNIGCRGINLLRTLSAERVKLIDQTGYTSFESFASHYEVNPNEALSTLFAEHFNNGKFGRLKGDLKNLYLLHIANPYDHFMKVMEAC